MSHRCSRNFWDRREFLFRPAAASAGSRWRICSARTGCWPPPRNRDACAAPAVGRQSVRAETAALQAARHGGHLAVHGRRLEPGGHVRSEAGAHEIRGRADRRQGARRRHRPAGLSGPADAEPVHVQEVRTERDRGLGNLSAPQPARRRDRVPAIGVRPIERPRAGHLRDADRPDQPRVPERRLVGHLRAGIGSVEPAGVRRDDRRARRSARRAATTGAPASCRRRIRARCSARRAIRSST